MSGAPRGQTCHSAHPQLQLSAAPQALAEGAFYLIGRPAWEGRAGWGWHLAFEGVKEEAQALWSLAVPAGAEAPRTLLEAFAHKPWAYVAGEAKSVLLQLSPGQGKFGHPLPGRESSVGANQGKQGPSRQGANDRAFCSLCSTSSTRFPLHFNTAWASSNPAAAARSALPLWKTPPE